MANIVICSDGTWNRPGEAAAISFREAHSHAMAIDEQREDFEPTIWDSRPDVDLKQVWFAGGAH